MRHPRVLSLCMVAAAAALPPLLAAVAAGCSPTPSAPDPVVTDQVALAIKRAGEQISGSIVVFAVVRIILNK